MSICTSTLWISFLLLTESLFCSCNTEVIALENTLHGLIFPQDEITRISEYARELGVRMHLDGARIWHVAIEAGTPLHELCEPFDSISVCFSKGLGQLRQYLRTPERRTDSELSPSRFSCRLLLNREQGIHFPRALV
jgi:Beta-eliminating lyase